MYFRIGSTLRDGGPVGIGGMIPMFPTQSLKIGKSKNIIV